MKWWTKFLPFIFVEWYAKKHLSRNITGNIRIVSPFNGVFFQVGEDDD